MPIYNSDATANVEKVTVQIGGETIGEASKAEISIEHGVNEHETFDGILLSAKSLPGGSVSLTRLTRHETTSESTFLSSLSDLVPQEGTFSTGNSSRVVSIVDARGEDYKYTLTDCYIDKFQSTYEGEEVPEFNVDIKSEKITVYSGKDTSSASAATITSLF